MSQQTFALLWVTGIVVSLTVTLRWLFNRDWGTPHYRRELEATYASFRRFLMTVQAVVVKRLQE